MEAVVTEVVTEVATAEATTAQTTDPTATFMDTASSSPHFSYRTASGENHVVWYENEASLRMKAQYAIQMGLGGVSIFALGYDSPNFWAALHNGGL